MGAEQRPGPLAFGCAQARVRSTALGIRMMLGNAEFEMRSGSGDPGLDGSVELLAFDIVRAFELPNGSWPALFFFKEEDGRPNCFEVDTPANSPLLPFTRGAVVIGITMAKTLLTSPALKQFPGAALAAVVAHEFAHAHQRLTGSFERLNDDDPTHFGQTPIRLLELHADFLAGFYMGRQSGFNERAMLDVTTAIAELGDTDFNNAMHHGQPSERAFCMYRGLNLAMIPQTTIAQASTEGERFVRLLMRTGL